VIERKLIGRLGAMGGDVIKKSPTSRAVDKIGEKMSGNILNQKRHTKGGGGGEQRQHMSIRKAASPVSRWHLQVDRDPFKKETGSERVRGRATRVDEGY